MRLLLVEDNPADARFIREMLKDSWGGDFEIQPAPRLDAALERLRLESFDVALLDLALPDSQGIATLNRLQGVCAGCPVVVLTGLDDERVALEAMRAGAQDYLVKGRFDGQLLIRTIRYAIERKRIQEEVRQLNAQLEQRVIERTAQLRAANQDLVKEINERQRAEEHIHALNRELQQRNAELDAERARWQGVVEGMADEVWICDARGRMSLVNLPTVTHMQLGEFKDRTLQQVLDEVDILYTDERTRPTEEAPLLRSLRGEICRGEEIMRDRRTGRTRYRQFSSAPVRDANGKITGSVAIVRDITDRKQAEEALAEKTRLLELSYEAILVRDQKDRIVYWNNGAVEAYGYTHDEALGRSSHELLHTRFPQPLSAVLETLQRDGRWTGELVHTRKDGSQIMVASRWAVDRDAQGNIAAILETNSDITERKRAEEALRQSEHRFRTLADAMPQLAWIAKADGWIYWYNRRWYEYTGTTPEQMEGWGWQSVHDSAALPAVLERWRASIATGSPFDMVFPLRGADGVFRDFLTRVMPLKDERGRVAQWFGTNTDISAQKRTEQALFEAKLAAENNMAQLRTTLDNLAEAIYVCDAKGKPLLTNPAFRRLIGLDAASLAQTPTGIAVQFPLFELDGRPVDIKDRPTSAALRGEIVSGRELCLRGQPGGDMILRYNAAPVRDARGNIIMAVLSIEDITAAKKAEEVLVRSEKLASVGRMAASISHEINNPLAAAINALYLAQMSESPSSSARQYLSVAQKELERVAHITKQTLGFYRETGKLHAVLLREVVEGVLELYGPKLEHNGVRIEREYAGTSAPIQASEGELRQVVSNLVANSIDALGGKGMLRLRTSAVQHWKGRPMVRVTVADNGCGIPRENLKRIFEPFFTTKDNVGTGLGLWVTKELVEKHDGRIRVRSRLGKGTVFTVWLPTERRESPREPADPVEPTAARSIA